MNTTQLDNYEKFKTSINREKPALNGRFGASGAVTRPKVCANLEVYLPSEL